GQICPGDRLEAVEGRSVVTLPHRELAQILRRAGNTLRLTGHVAQMCPSVYTVCCVIFPAENNNQPSFSLFLFQRDSRYYSVDLDRGPSGFGFSLRGGSEYNMGLYVLGLMEGGPASNCGGPIAGKLVEINGNSTTGMTHSQAVEQIRRGGQRIHLVLKRGNDQESDVAHSLTFQRPLPGVAVLSAESQRKPFSFLTSTLSVDQLGDADSESGDSLSDVSISAASISSLSLTARETDRPRAGTLPNLWLKPSKPRLVQFVTENRQPGSQS
uniref:PDZ domain-containing protein n=1 Tax=Oryzias latipes TaxID=8090 RepID=A0A3P9J037_ORYLA